MALPYITKYQLDELERKLLEKMTAGVWGKGTGLNSTQTVGTACKAEGDNSVAEGELSRTVKDSGAIEEWREGKGAHAEGGGTLAAGNYSHAEGNGTVTNNPYEHAEGHFNKSHFTQAVYPHAKNTISSIGIGSNISNAKNAVEVMENGDMYIIGIGGYDGTNIDTAQTVQQAITGGGSSAIMPIAENVELNYNADPDDPTTGYFDATIPMDLFPSDFFTDAGKYNLIMVFTGNDDGMQLGYTANHFCYQLDNGTGMFLCMDNIEEEGGLSIKHMSTAAANSGNFAITYIGTQEGTTMLPSDNSKVAVYLQQLR